MRRSWFACCASAASGTKARLTARTTTNPIRRMNHLGRDGWRESSRGLRVAGAGRVCGARLNHLVRSSTVLCSDALSLEHQNAKYDENQRQQPSNAERFLQEHEPNKQDDAHLSRR